jgi:hypothetical protein
MLSTDGFTVCFFQLLTPLLIPVSLLERELGFDIVTELLHTGINLPLSHPWSMSTTQLVGAIRHRGYRHRYLDFSPYILHRPRRGAVRSERG